MGVYDDIAKHLAVCESKMQGLLAKLGQDQVDIGKAPRAHPHQRTGGDIGDENSD